MTSTVSILAVGVAGFGGCCALVGGVAKVATLVSRPRTARFLAAQSAVADRRAASIAAGEQDARDAEDHLALAAGCAHAIRRLLPAEPPALDWWSRGIDGIEAAPRDPGTDDPLRLAACMQYCLDLAGDRLYAAGRHREADRRTRRPMGHFRNSGILDRIDGWTHLGVHRLAGMRELAGETSGPGIRCPFCGFGLYDQAWMRCDRCLIEGEMTRTFPTAALPKRTAPNLKLAARRVADIEARDRANLYDTTRSN